MVSDLNKWNRLQCKVNLVTQVNISVNKIDAKICVFECFNKEGAVQIKVAPTHAAYVTSNA